MLLLIASISLASSLRSIPDVGANETSLFANEAKLFARNVEVVANRIVPVFVQHCIHANDAASTMRNDLFGAIRSELTPKKPRDAEPLPTLHRKNRTTYR